jgi:hypothetical protein
MGRDNDRSLAHTNHGDGASPVPGVRWPHEMGWWPDMQAPDMEVEVKDHPYMWVLHVSGGGPGHKHNFAPRCLCGMRRALCLRAT